MPVIVEDLRARVAANARELIRADGRKGAELADAAGFDLRTLRRITAGEKLSLATLLPLATALGVDVSAFVAKRE